jgi:O-antigen/teichoic acid export membrane protein
MRAPRTGPGAAALGRRIARDSLVLAPSYLVPGLASLLAIPLLFRPLGAEGYGTWALVFAIANGVPVVTSSWLEAISVRFGHRAGGGAGPLRYAASILASCVAAAVLAAWIIPAADAAIVLATVAFTGAVVVYLLVQARLQARMAFAAMSRSASVRAIAVAVLAVAAAVVTGAPAAAAVGAALGFTIGTLVALPDALRPAGAPSSPSITEEPGVGRNAELGFGAASAVIALAAYVLSVGDRFVLTSLRPLAEVGVYAATYAVVDLVLRLVPSIVFGVVRPRLFRAWDRGDREAAAHAVSILAVLLAWGSAALVAAFMVVTSLAPAVRLDPHLVGPIAVGLGAFVVGNAVALLYASSERQARQAVHVVAGAVLNIALNLALDGALGARGAAIATAVSYAFVLALHVHGLRRTLARDAVLDIGLATAVAAVAGVSAWLGPAAGVAAGSVAGVAIAIRVVVARRGLGGRGEPNPG